MRKTSEGGAAMGVSTMFLIMASQPRRLRPRDGAVESLFAAHDGGIAEVPRRLLPAEVEVLREGVHRVARELRVEGAEERTDEAVRGLRQGREQEAEAARQ